LEEIIFKLIIIKYKLILFLFFLLLGCNNNFKKIENLPDSFLNKYLNNCKLNELDLNEINEFIEENFLPETYTKYIYSISLYFLIFIIHITMQLVHKD
jgi:hypothetical protein